MRHGAEKVNINAAIVPAVGAGAVRTVSLAEPAPHRVARSAVLWNVDLFATCTEAHRGAWRRLSAELGLPLAEERLAGLRGLCTTDCVEKLLAEHARGFAREEKLLLAMRKEQYFLELLNPCDLQAAARGALAIIQRFDHTAVACAFSAGHAAAATVMEQIFPRRGNPLFAPEGRYYPPAFSDLLASAADALHVAPAHCVWVDADAAGLHAAQRVGMRTVLVSGGGRAAVVADRVVPGVEAVTPECVLELAHRSQRRIEPRVQRVAPRRQPPRLPLCP